MYRTALLIGVILILAACKHPLAIQGQGDIVDLNGTLFGCTLEQFEAEDIACTENEVGDEDYIVNYEARPHEGWQFVRWEGTCGKNSVAPDCAFTSPTLFTTWWNENLPDTDSPPLTAVFKPLSTASGSVVAPTRSGVDSDTNDPNANYVSNDTPAEAPKISNPIALGGYVNEPGTGEVGRSQESGDIDDYYRVELLAGQVITMAVSDFETGDADLYLYDSTGETIIDASLGLGEIESLTVAASGTYFVNAYAFAGASNYVLVIGNSNSIASAKSELRLSSEFALGQAVVGYDKSRDKTQAQSFQTMATRAGFSVLAGREDREMLLELTPPASSQFGATAVSAPAHSKSHAFRNAEDHAKWQTLMAIKALRKDPTVKYAEPNYRVRATAIPNDPSYPAQWHYPLINLPAAWDLETGDSNVIVAVIDTGVLLNHPDMQGQLVPGYDFIQDLTTAGDGDGIDSNPDDPGDSDGRLPSSFHGTHVAGTVAAATNNGSGIAGVAWGAKIMPLRVLGVDGGFGYDIRQAVLFAAGLPNDSRTVPVQRADVINLSLGGGPFSQAAQEVYTQARNAGVIIVAAASNDGSSKLEYPASYAGVISVSAVDTQRQLSYYSNFGTEIDVAAPGGDTTVDKNGDGFDDGVLSTLADDSSGSINFNYQYYQGTSMAAPHMAGVMALMKSANSNVTPDFVDEQLIAGNLTDELGAPGRDDKFGHGLINALKAVTAALNLGGTAPPSNPTLGVTPTSLNFDAVTSAIDIAARNVSTGDLEVTDIVPNQPWISFAPVSVDAENLGSYSVSVDRDGLADGLYSGQLSVQSSVNTVNVSVIMTVDATPASGDVGTIYVLLIDATSGEVLLDALPSVSGGRYAYTFSDVPDGTYEIIAGTDSDNDFIICDPGEACGVLGTLDQPVQLELSSDRENLDFPINYIVALPAVGANSKGAAKPKRGFSRKAKTAVTGVSR